MELIVSGSFKCQVFLELYMKLEDIKLIDKGRLELNETFVGQNASFWWKSKNDAMLPSGIFFDSFNNVQINILNSSKTVPYFLRIGSFQPLPSMKFKFDESCNGAEFELFINLQNTPDCQIRIHQVKEGFKFSTKSSSSDEFIKDPSLSPTLIMGKNGIYVKIASLLTIKSYPICNVSTPDVPADQFVIQISRIHKIACKKAEVTILKEDVANGIEILIDRSKIPLPTPAGILNSTVVSATAFLSAKAALEWWWFVAGGILLFLILCVALPILIICIYRRKKKQPTKKRFGKFPKVLSVMKFPFNQKNLKIKQKQRIVQLRKNPSQKVFKWKIKNQNKLKRKMPRIKKKMEQKKILQRIKNLSNNLLLQENEQKFVIHFEKDVDTKKNLLLMKK
uniref:Uncharacterized protein n=1 Tax=Panagrolaimus superbus TaxID=310955 RepID=A0A914YUK2_9BILA